MPSLSRRKSYESYVNGWLPRVGPVATRYMVKYRRTTRLWAGLFGVASIWGVINALPGNHRLLWAMPALFASGLALLMSWFYVGKAAREANVFHGRERSQKPLPNVYKRWWDFDRWAKGRVPPEQRNWPPSVYGESPSGGPGR